MERSTIITATKLFLGCLISNEIKALLHSSKKWQEVSEFKIKEGDSLEEISFQEQNYIGFMLPSNEISLDHLYEAKDRLCKKLNSYCPDLETDKIQIHIFPQFLLG